jgi:hypothetical protein
MKAPVKGTALPLVAGLALVVAAFAGCGDLDNVTTVKDLRVLAVSAEPPGFLVPLDAPETIPATESTVTALVVDPMGQAATLTFSPVACPDFVDTITAASGKGSKLCPDKSVTDALPKPLDTLLATTNLPVGTAAPLSGSTIEYNPSAKFGISPDDLRAFFSLAPHDPPDPVLDSPTFKQAVQYNRDFSMDAIVGFNFTLGAEQATALKRIVYWPKLPAELAVPTPADDHCAGEQVANQNPKLTDVGFFRHRVEGVAMDPYPDPPVLSLAAKDELYVQPIFDASAAEYYLLRVNNLEAGRIETRCRHELLTFKFYATAGTFSPADRQSELPPFLTGIPRFDSQYNPGKAENVISFGKVTIWVVVSDERAGVSWTTRTFSVQP